MHLFTKCTNYYYNMYNTPVHLFFFFCNSLQFININIVIAHVYTLHAKLQTQTMHSMQMVVLAEYYSRYMGIVVGQGLVGNAYMCT